MSLPDRRHRQRTGGALTGVTDRGQEGAQQASQRTGGGPDRLTDRGQEGVLTGVTDRGQEGAEKVSEVITAKPS